MDRPKCVHNHSFPKTSSYGTEEYLEKQYLDVLFSETVRKITRYGSKQYLYKCHSTQCILFGSRNAVVNGVYFDISESTEEYLVHSAQPIYYNIAALSTHAW